MPVIVARGLRFIQVVAFALLNISDLPLWTQYFVNVGLKGRTLVVLERWGGIGDLICLLASVRGLRARHPASWFVLITPYGCAQLGLATRLCDAVTETQTSFHRFIRKVCGSERYYVPLLPDERTPPRSRSRIHLADEFAQVLGTSADLESVALRTPARVRGRIIKRLHDVNPEGRPIIVVHSGPTWPVKEWPIERWSELMGKIAANGSVIIRVGTDFDPAGRYVSQEPVPNTINWIGRLALLDLVALLEQASIFVGVDSGPLHIATALGVPSVGLFGPTDGRLHVHPRARAVIVSGTSSCLGCHYGVTGPGHWKTGCANDIVCMREITVDQVLSAVFRVLNRTATRARATVTASRLSVD